MINSNLLELMKKCLGFSLTWSHSFLSQIVLFDTVIDIFHITRAFNPYFFPFIQALESFEYFFGQLLHAFLCDFDNFDILICMNPLHTNQFHQSLLGVYYIKQCIHFSDPEPSTISILYGWSEICDQCVSCSCLVSPVTSLKLIMIFIFPFFFVSQQFSLAYHFSTKSHRNVLLPHPVLVKQSC